VVPVRAHLAEVRKYRRAGKTLSGLHSKYVLALVDESGAIPLTVLRAAEQALSNCTFGKIVQAGNPISLDGMLYAAASPRRHLWHVIRITADPDDPNRSPRVDLAWAREQIATYGHWALAGPSAGAEPLGRVPGARQRAQCVDLPLRRVRPGGRRLDGRPNLADAFAALRLFAVAASRADRAAGAAPGHAVPGNPRRRNVAEAA
jgi:hypothetical protein